MWINYRKPEDAVVNAGHRNRYGYFASLRVPHIKTGEEMLLATVPPREGVWPLRLCVELDVCNHEDLQHFVDALVQAYDETRGEHGEKERISPSELTAKIHGV